MGKFIAVLIINEMSVSQNVTEDMKDMFSHITSFFIFHNITTTLCSIMGIWFQTHNKSTIWKKYAYKYNL